ncbi:hypothetical protein KFK09_023779 [Dendrobium nobile]|uniref:Uncharacterized protein n=1 Tax=Dendrobium nobile TaxID=94219 RepID=A0A8T3AC14_DENNO|nr:hypothetical protein KFK09_023779 [Dendrobium nobile]
MDWLELFFLADYCTEDPVLLLEGFDIIQDNDEAPNYHSRSHNPLDGLRATRGLLPILSLSRRPENIADLSEMAREMEDLAARFAVFCAEGVKSSKKRPIRWFYVLVRRDSIVPSPDLFARVLISRVFFKERLVNLGICSVPFKRL